MTVSPMYGGDGNCVNKVNGYTYNCDTGHELLLLRGQNFGTFPRSRIIQWSPRNRDVGVQTYLP